MWDCRHRMGARRELCAAPEQALHPKTVILRPWVREHLFVWARPQNCIRGDIWLCRWGSWDKMGFAYGKDSVCSCQGGFFAAVCPGTSAVHIKAGSHLLGHRSKHVIWYLFSSFRLDTSEVLGNGRLEKFLHFVTKWWVFSFYDVDSVWNWVVPRAIKFSFSSFSKRSPELPVCSDWSPSVHRLADLSWGQLRAVFER